MIERVEDVAHLGEDISPVFAPLVAGIAEDVELDEKQLFELQSHPGTLQTSGFLWVMDGSEGLVTTHQVATAYDKVCQGFR